MIRILKKTSVLLPGLIAFIIYITTTCKSIWIGDSGEFSLALKTLGICHPPGYPLFTILGRLFIIILPFFRTAFAANIFNIIVTAVGVTVIFLLFRRNLSYWSSLLLSLIWALNPLYWAETAGVEIYTLNLLLIALTIYILESDSPWKWYPAIYVFGLSLTNHPSALSNLPVLVYYFIREKEYLNRRRFPVYILLILVAGSVYLYLLIRSSQNPLADWGNPSTIGALIKHMTLYQYKGWIDNSWANVFYSFKLFMLSLLQAWGYPGLLITIAGTVAGFFIFKKRTITALLILICSILLSSSHQAVNFDPFYIPAVFASLLLSGNLLIWIENKNRPPVLKYVSYIILGSFCFILLFHNYRGMDKSDYTLNEDYAKYLLDTAGEGILLTAGDINSFATLYLRYVEEYKPRVEVYDRSIRLRELIKQAQILTGQNFDDYYSARSALLKYYKGDKYLAKNHYFYEPEWLNVEQPFYSYGILYAVGRKPENKATVPEYPYGYDPGDVLSRQLLLNLDLARGEQSLADNDSVSAMKAFNMVIYRIEKEPRAIVLNNIGIYFRNTGLLDPALNVYQKALAKPLIGEKTKNDILFNISNVHKDKGNNYLSRGDYGNAVASYEEALQYDRDNANLIRNLGIIYGQVLSDTSSAVLYLEKYLDKNRSDEQMKSLLETLRK